MEEEFEQHVKPITGNVMSNNDVDLGDNSACIANSIEEEHMYNYVATEITVTTAPLKVLHITIVIGDECFPCVDISI